MTREDDGPVGTGIAGLDFVLEGGLTPNRIYLVEGNPGAGKTTLALQFLLEGVRCGEPALYMTLSESALELEVVARSHGWSLDGVSIREYVLNEAVFNHEQVTMFHPSEVELGETLQRMLSDVDELKPGRVVLDALSELRLLAETPIRYRRQLLAFKQFFLKRHCTVLLLDDRSGVPGDPHVQSVLHGVMMLEQHRTAYGSDRRQLRVGKLRGRAFRTGAHDYEIRRGGLQVFPRLVAAEHGGHYERRAFESGLPALDALLGGGPQAGTSTLLMGPAGVGKTTLAMQYASSAARRGERATVFSFEESIGTLVSRLGEIGIEVAPLVESGHLELQQIDPVSMSPGEFAHQVCTAVDRDGARLIVIDSLNGYLNSMPSEKQLTAQLHELLSYLANRGVVTFIVLGQQGLVGPNVVAPIDASYLADSILLMRYFEAGGRVRKAMSVTKKRGGGHETTIRELIIDADGLQVGAPLSAFRGVLAGSPEFVGAVGDLLPSGAASGVPG
jgi:circadian clock protein KaiC